MNRTFIINPINDENFQCATTIAQCITWRERVWNGWDVTAFEFRTKRTAAANFIVDVWLWWLCVC